LCDRSARRAKENFVKNSAWIAFLGTTLAAAAAVASPTTFPRGTTRIAQSQMAPGWVVFTASDGIAYVIDQTGTPVNQWISPDPDNPSLGYAQPLIDAPGHILTLINAPMIEDCDSADCGKIMELDWDGNLVWEYEDTERSIHHDFERLPSGNTLMMCSKTIRRPEIAPGPLIDDCLIEVDPSGEVIWEWQTADHYDELDLTDEERELISVSQGPPLNGDWSHGNAIDSIAADTPHLDPRFREGNVVVSYRHLNLVIIVDRDTDEIVWQNKAAIGQHNSYMITNGFDGNGNILVFDNGSGGQYPPIATSNSRIIEIDPNTDEIVYEYNATRSGIAAWTFFSAFLGSAQRLPNGNTLINEGMFGRVFEVTPDGKMAWEFVNPTGSDAFGFIANTVYRYTKMPVDWAGPLKAGIRWSAPGEGPSQLVPPYRY